MRKIEVFIKDPGKKARHVWISDSLDNLQKTVKGYIEIARITSDTAVICDEEGRIKDGATFNCLISGYEFFGTIILVGIDGEDITSWPYSLAITKTVFPQLFEE